MRVLELSPRGAGGVAVIALRGPGALGRLRELLPRARLAPGAVVLARLELAGSSLDEVLACVRGEEDAELHLHGSPALVREILAALGATRVEDAAPSEPELAARLLRDAPCDRAARILLDQAEGALACELARLAPLDEEGLRRGLAALAERSRVARSAIEPATVVLAGPVNAGKSTLFNLLVGAERAAVSAEAGTTRDALRERAMLGAYAVDLLDTAGARALDESSAVDRVEAEAQALARNLERSAALVIALRPPGAPGDDRPRGRTARLTLASMAELWPAAERPADAISSVLDPAGARARVEAAFHETLRLPREPWERGRGVVLGPRARRSIEEWIVAPERDLRSGVERLLEESRPLAR